MDNIERQKMRSRKDAVEKLPSDIQRQVYLLHMAAIEFLRQYWTVVGSSVYLTGPKDASEAARNAQRAEKMIEHLKHTELKVRAVIKHAHDTLGADFDESAIRTPLGPMLQAVSRAITSHKSAPA